MSGIHNRRELSPLKMPPGFVELSIWECRLARAVFFHSKRAELSRPRFHAVSAEATSPKVINHHLAVCLQPVPLQSSLSQGSQRILVSSFRTTFRLSNRTLFFPAYLIIHRRTPQRQLTSLSLISERVQQELFICRHRKKIFASAQTGSGNRIRRRTGTTNPASRSGPNTPELSQFLCRPVFGRAEHRRRRR